MKIVKVRNASTADWKFDRQTNDMTMQFEWRIPLNFGGHDGENTVGELRDLLNKLPTEATFSVHEDGVSGRETMYVYLLERRAPTDQERLEEFRRVQAEAQLAADQEAARERVRAVQERGRKRREILRTLDALDAAIHMVQNQVGSCGDPEARATFQEELEDLLAEKHRFQTDLSQM